jgi:hypothetical protein
METKLQGGILMMYSCDGKSILKVIYEPGDKLPYTESGFWFMLKHAMKRQGHDMVKKAPAKDGHLTSAPYYLRDRKGRYAIHDGQYMLRDLAADFRLKIPVYLEIYGDFPGVINMETLNESCGSCGADIGPSTSCPWHEANEDCRAVREPLEVNQ